MSQKPVNNYLKLIVRLPQTDDDRKYRRLGRMVTHELFTFGPGDGDVEGVRVTLEQIAQAEREAGNTADVSAFNPYYLPRDLKKPSLPRIGALDFARSKMNLAPSQLADRHHNR